MLLINGYHVDSIATARSLMIIKTLETTLVHLHHLLLYRSWRVDFLNSLSTLVRAPSHNVFLHLELQAAVITNKPFVFSFFVFGEHKRGVALLTQMALAVFSKLLKHLIFREEVVVECLGGSDALSWVLLQQSFHEVEP